MNWTKFQGGVLTLMCFGALTLLIIAETVRINVPFVSTKTGRPVDSATAYLNAGGVDTTGPVRIPDSSATDGGAYVTYWVTNEDTAQATISAEWGFLDPNTKTIRWFLTKTTLAPYDTTGIFNSTNTLIKTEPLCFRKPKGADVVRLLITGGTLIGGWGTGGTGTKRIASHDVSFLVPK